MSKRRIAWIAVALLALAAGGTGLWWHVRRSTGTRLLVRANLALQADKLGKALELARDYAAKHPEDWRGYYTAAVAQSRQGKHEEARAQLMEAQRRRPQEAAIALALAETYSLPAGQALVMPATRENMAILRDAIGRFQKAIELLEAFRPDGEDGALQVRQALGLAWRKLARAQSTLCAQLERELRVAEASRAVELAEERRKEGQEAAAAAQESIQKAIATLLEIVQKDAARALAAESLVEMCIESGDLRSLELARKAIDASPEPPPVAAMLLAVHELQGAEMRIPAERARAIEAASRRLDQLLRSHPGDTRVKLARGELALSASDPATAERLASEVLQAEARNSGASLLHARALLAQQRFGEAEVELFQLTAQLPRWYLTHYWYALAAESTGKRQLAHEAMRAVTRLRPDHREARKYLARLLLSDFPDQAFEDAKAAYQADPNDPESLLLFVEAARRTDQPMLARRALEDTRQGGAADPVRLMAASNSYLSLGDPDAARQTAAEAAAIVPRTDAGRTAVAEALIRLDRGSEADKLLYEAIQTDPNSAQAHFALARRFDSSGRDLQAREHYRKAVELDPQSPTYRLALAGSLVNARDLDEALAVLEPILPTSEPARNLQLQIKVLGGQTADVDAATQKPGPAAAGLALAEVYLRTGQVDRCIDVCRAELDKNPDNLGCRVLLGQACLFRGQRDQCIEAWTAVVTARPERLPIYQALAGAMADRGGPAQIAAALAGIIGARQDMVDVTVAGLYRQRGQYLEAARLYDKVAGNTASPEGVRYQAALDYAMALALGGQPDEAVRSLDRLLMMKVLPLTTMQAKAELLGRLGRTAEAEAALKELVAAGVAAGDARALRGAVANYMQLRKPQLALPVCDEVRRLAPLDPRTYLVRAEVLAAAGQGQEVPALYEKAIQLQPTDLRLHLALADVHDALQNPLAALAALRTLDGLGDAGRFLGRFHEATLHLRWGLKAEAVKRYERLSGDAATPAQQLALGRALHELERSAAARAVLVRVPEHTRSYVEAQLLLADIADTLEQKLALLRGLAGAAHAGAMALDREIAVLMEENKPAQAVEAFRAAVATGKARGREFATPAARAFAAALKAGDNGAALLIAALLADATGEPRWRATGVLLLLDVDPAAAAKQLPEPAAADWVPAMLGLALALRTDDQASLKAWDARLAQLEQEWSTRQPPKDVPASQKLLLALAATDGARAKACLPRLEAAARADGEAARELLAAHQRGGLAPGELLRLLQAHIALEIAQPELAGRHAMAALEARPTCQWAALLATRFALASQPLAKVAGVLQPQDCYVARLFQAQVKRDEGKFAEAAAIYAKLAEAYPEDVALLLDRGMAEERAENLPEAVSLYRRVWDATKDPRAGNNWAYLASELWPKDAAKLAEARKIAEEVTKVTAPAPFLDTAGWIAYLQGRTADACRLLRQAVRGQPGSAEVHYHLGLAEAAAGNNGLARMHLYESVRIGEQLGRESRTTGVPAPLAERKSVESAKQALLEIAPPTE